MNNLKKIGLSALAGSLTMFSVAQADLVLSGSTEATYTTSDKSVTGSPFGLTNDFTLTGTGEMDNGWTYKAHTNFEGQDMATSSNYLLIDMGALGKLSLDQGNEVAGISGMTNYGNPSAYEEADHGVSTLDDKLNANQTGAIGYSNSYNGVSLSLEVIPSVTGTSVQAGGTSGAGETTSNMNYMLSGAVPGVEGLTLAIGQDTTKSSVAGVKDDTGMSAGARYSFSNITMGYQIVEQQSGVASSNGFAGEMVGIAVNINENFSVSYNLADMTVDKPGSTDVTEESTGISGAYTMGSASVRVSYNQVDNQGGVTGVSDDQTEISLALAF